MSQQNNEEEQPKGLLSSIGDPIGKVAEKGLSPLGAGVGAITRPVSDTLGGVTKPILSPVTGSKDERAQMLGGTRGKEEKIGGKDQTGQNPLGL